MISLTSHVKRSNSSAFTLMELAVVLVVVALLAIVVFPAFATTTERAQRAACMNNLRRIAAGVAVYGGNNNGKIFSARNGSVSPPNIYVQIALNLPDATLAGTVGLVVGSNSPAWTCPNRPAVPIYEPAYPQWIIGYQYFGGINTWMNSLGTFTSVPSPTNLATARPYWTLAADVILRDGAASAWGVWSPGRDSLIYSNVPPHHAIDSLRPQGGNHAFVDGSVQWIDLEKMYMLHSYSPSSRLFYFYQDSKDFPASMKPFLSTLRPQP